MLTSNTSKQGLKQGVQVRTHEHKLPPLYQKKTCRREHQLTMIFLKAKKLNERSWNINLTHRFINPHISDSIADLAWLKDNQRGDLRNAFLKSNKICDRNRNMWIDETSQTQNRCLLSHEIRWK